jgi:hypothetical protein
MKPVVATVSVSATATATATPEPVPIAAELQELKETIADLREQTIVLLETKAEALREEAKVIDEVKQTLSQPTIPSAGQSSVEQQIVQTVQSSGCCTALATAVISDAVDIAEAVITAATDPESTSEPTSEPISSQPSESNDAPQTPPSSLEETTVIKPDTSVL